MIILLTEDEYDFLQSYEFIPLTVESKIYPHPFGIGTYIDETQVVRVKEDYYLSTDSGRTFVKTIVQI